MSSRTASAPRGSGEQQQHPHVRAAPRGGLPRPGTPRPPGSASTSGRQECNWWGAAARQAAAAEAARPRRPRSAKPGARVPTGKGNRELVRRALAPPAARGRGGGVVVLARRWSFRPAPSRLRHASATPPASPRPRPS